MRDRSLIHFKHLNGLQTWAEERGWTAEPAKNCYEVLRLRKDKEVAIFHARDRATEHVTIWGASAKLGRAFLREMRAQQVEA